MNKVKGQEFINNVVDKCDKFLEFLEHQGKAPNNQKVLERRFSIQSVSEMVKRSRPTIYKAEEDGVIIPDTSSTTGKKLGYTLEQVNILRDYFGTRPSRRDGDPCLKLAIQSFKGGVAKSVTSVHLAQYLALKGYKVLLADFDPQASATLSFGYIPDQAFSRDDTLLPYIKGEKDDLRYCIRHTYFPGISIIPSCLPFYDAEFQLAFAAAASANEEERIGYFTEFNEAFKAVESDFDIIIFDSPPALGMITINILSSADCLVVPSSVSFFDFSSTIQYFKMIKTVVESIVPDKEYNFVKILATRVEKRNSHHEEFFEYMREMFGTSLLSNKLEQSRDIVKLSIKFKTLFDVNPTKKLERVLNSFNSVCEEIENEIIKWWPSRNKSSSTKVKQEVLDYV